MRMSFYIMLFYVLGAGAMVSCEICTICNCVFVDVDTELLDNIETSGLKYKTETLEPFNSSITYKSLKKYFLVDCSSYSNVGQLNKLDWPELDVLGIFGKFESSKWKKIEFFPDHAKELMTTLSLADNQILEVEPKDLVDFRRLKMLNLSGNHIEALKKASFGKLSELKILDVSRNAIAHVEDWVFYGTKLIYLNLSKNSLTHLASDSLRGLNNLEVLDLSENKLTKLSDDFGSHLQSLTYLFLCSNSLTKLPEMPKELKEMYLRHNMLTELNLSHSNLQVLDIGNNNIINFGGLNAPLLKVIKANNNQLSGSLELKSHGIVIMDLSYNKFTSLPHDLTVDRFHLLEKLYLDGNRLNNTSFPHQSGPFLYLMELSFSNCSLKKLPKHLFKGILPNSKVDCFNAKGISLNFSHNLIDNVDDEVFQHFSLCSLDLSNNKLRTLSNSSLSWTEMSYLDLQKNPWHCNCDIQWMLSYYMAYAYNNYPKLLFELRCATPRKYSDKMFAFWYNRTQDVFCKSGPSTLYLDVISGRTIEIWTASAIACIVLTCFICILIIAIIILMCTKPSKRRNKQKKKQSQISNNYTAIQQNSQSKSQNDGLI